MIWSFDSKEDNLVWQMLAMFYVWWFQFLNGTPGFVGCEDATCDCFNTDTALTEGNKITIIVPVYNAYDELKKCIESVVNKTKYPYRLLIMDDSSSDHRIRPLLQAYAATYPNIFVKHNDRNLGYTATINKGCELAAPDDVVLLNSDTQVTFNWLRKLSDCAKISHRTATVTPLSNAAGQFSLPVKNRVNRIPDFLSIDDMGAMVERLSLGLRPLVPTGNGYCMYVTRKALNIVGNFDEKHFPKGYGEENDFCLRASKRGFLHFIEDSTYIYHQRTASFKSLKKDIFTESMKTLTRLHPEYKYLVLKWRISDPLDGFRKILKKSISV